MTLLRSCSRSRSRYRRRGVVLSHEDAARRTTRFRRWSLIFLTVWWGGAVWCVFVVMPMFSVTNISIDGVVRLSREEVENTVADVLAKPRWGIIAGDRLVAWQWQTIEGDLRAHFALIKDVDVTVIPPRRVHILVTEYEPTLVVCHHECVIVDINGAAIAQENDPRLTLTDEQRTRLFRLTIEGDSDVFRGIFTAARIRSILAATRSVGSEIQLAPDGHVMRTTHARDLFLQTRDGVQIFASLDLPEQETTRLMRAASAAIGGQWQTVSAVDVRVRNKVFYTLKKEQGGDDAQ